MGYCPIRIVVLACVLVNASCLPSTSHRSEHGCPESTLVDSRVREIGYSAVRSKFKDVPKEPIEVRVARYGCNYAYMEVYDSKTIGDFVTVLISPDGRVLAVAPGL
jgi:hypothetical protein